MSNFFKIPSYIIEQILNDTFPLTWHDIHESSSKKADLPTFN